MHAQEIGAEERRAAFLRCARVKLLGFFAGTWLMMDFMEGGSVFRNELIAIFGKPAFLWIVLGGSLASFLVVPSFAQWIAERDPHLCCPHCRTLLTGIRAGRRLFNHADCLYCHGSVPVLKATRRQSWGVVLMLFGGFLLTILLYVVPRLAF